ncbi:MAG: carbamoyl-phosphate synthase large subunit [Gammaproteobacteria bacterium]|nr:carbamoyl-phosphate synthase large subunit [Gammaproteobacteria bacterium]
MKLLIANRGEIAVRIAAAAQDLGHTSVAIYSRDDELARHVAMADAAYPLDESGVSAYLNVDAIVGLAVEHACDAVHPGYGFLSENALFAQACEDANLSFIGPTPATLTLFGDKSKARRFAVAQGVPTIAGSEGAITVEEAEHLVQALPKGASLLLKAVNGGGGRGMRQVDDLAGLREAFERASSEARAAFGDEALYAEQLLRDARHIELQVIGDGHGKVKVVGDRDCSLQRRHQKILEIAPAVGLADSMRKQLADAAGQLALAANYRSLGTFEFLVVNESFYFIEANARLQVEHTITEEATGVDLVQTQLRLATGEDLDELANPVRDRFSIQARVNMEVMNADGTTKPSGGILQRFDPPFGPNVRVDTYGYQGYATNPNFDSLLAKVICSGDTFEAALNRTERALNQFDIQGIATNRDFLVALLRNDNVRSMGIHTKFVDEIIPSLLESIASETTKKSNSPITTLAGTRLASDDPLAVLDHGKSGEFTRHEQPETTIRDTTPVPAGTTPVRAPMQGTVVEISVDIGDEIGPDTIVAIMEAMKMEHEIRAGTEGVVHACNVTVGDAVYDEHALLFIEEREVAVDSTAAGNQLKLDELRPDVAEVIERHAITLDEHRPDAVEKRRTTNQRTARENIDDLCDADSFVEHGQLAVTPGTGLPFEQAIRKFPTDGMITGVGSVNGEQFGKEKSRTVVMAYDYTVLAGTQGAINHPKTDRMLELAEKWRIPLVLFAEGGGGRAGTGGKREGGQSTTTVGQGRDAAVYRPLDTPTFASMGRLSGLVPMVGITSRYCFAGNASLLGCCDVIIATENSNIGMGGPALIEGGNLGVFRPEEVGPLEVQRKNGVIDVVVKDEEEAVAAAKQYLSYFQGARSDWECADQRRLRHIVPENRLRVYNVRDVIHTIADTGSVLELRPDFGLGMVTAFIRIEGRPVGVIANNPTYLSGAIDSDGSDNAARFLQLCDGFDIPILILCDTPGMMVGPEIEKTALVRHCSRLFVTGANLTVPHVTIVLRKAYGLGAQAMAGGSFKEPFAVVAWPTAEFGGMGLEGQVKLGFRNELAAIPDPVERKARYDELVEAAYQRGKALVAGTSFAVDDVIDPADSRRWVSAAFDSAPPPTHRTGKKRRNIDTW